MTPRLDKRDKAFTVSLLVIAILLSLLGAFLDLPLMYRADTAQEIDDKHTLILCAWLVWAVAMVFWVWWFWAKGRLEASWSGGQTQTGVNWNNIGCLGLTLGFLGLLALRTAVSILGGH